MNGDLVAIVPLGRAVEGDLMVAGQTMLDRTLTALARIGRLAEIVLVGEAGVVRSEPAAPVRLLVVEPGTGRLDAIRAALAAAGPAPRVLIHEPDRPLTSPGCIEAVLLAAEGLPAAVAAVPARNTLKRVVDGRVVETVPRERLHQVQTPAVFERAVLDDALRRDRREGWSCPDELTLVTRAGIPIRLVPGDLLNVRVSTSEAVPFAELTLSRSSA